MPLLAVGLGLLLGGCGTSNVTFSPQLVGTASSPRTFQVSGFTQQSVKITISGLQVTGDKAAFTETDNCDNQVIPPNGSCTVAVSFAPTQPGPAKASANFYADYTLVGQTHPIEEDEDTANLSGIGLGPSSTSVTCAPPSVLVGQSASCTATVSDVLASDTYTPSGTVSFSSDNPSSSFSGGGSCTLAGATGARQASCTVLYTPQGATSDGQTDTIAASFTPSTTDYHAPSTSSGREDGTVVVHMQPTTLVYNGATSGDYQDAATLSATLTLTGTGAPVPLQTVGFKVGAESCSAVTNQQGTARCSVSPLDAPAGSPYPITATFAGGDGYAASSDSSAAFTVTREQAAAAYTGPAAAVQGGSVSLTGSLLADGNPADPIAGRTLTLSLGAQTCSTLTGPDGVATCAVTAAGPLGPQPTGASFAGDGYYLPASAQAGTAIVFALPARGAFAVGDGSLAAVRASGNAGTLTWWGSGWAASNTLTGGTAPAAFKGFSANVPDLATIAPGSTCSGAWTSAVGNSAAPPGTVPSYMGVLVSGQVTESGETISGHFDGIAIVKVNPGYGAAPGHAGTGTVVAMYCG